LTSSELVVKMDEIKFKCMISSNVDVIDRMKIKMLSFPPKSGMLKFRTRLGKNVRYMYVKRRKASVLFIPVAVHE
jgi:hypothetical protein